MDSSGVYEKRDWVKTLPGMGPKVTMTDMARQACRQAYEKELERFDWLVQHVRPFLDEEPAECWIERLHRRPRMPGAVEGALVALSLLAAEDTLAALALEDYSPPEGEEALEKLYRVCLTVARYNAGEGV